MKMMKGMLIALTPITLAAIWFYRLPAVMLILVSVVSALAAEALWQLAFKKPVKLKDGSAAVTGLLLALTVSPSLSLPIMAAGSVFGIIIGKQIWGGFGKNIINPALTGRLFIVFAFPGSLAPWLAPIDLVSTATPLQKFWADGTLTSNVSLLLGNVAGSIGETSALLLLIGGAWLIWKGYANWRIPAGCLGAVALWALIAGHDPLFHLLSGSLLLGALFMATDPATSPRTQSGRWIFGVLVGAGIMAMRFFTTYPEGTTFAILFFNLTVPLINKLTVKKKKTAAAA